MQCWYRRRNTRGGFTLAELLIALLVLGVIVTFTVPKVLQAQRDSRWRAMTKETAAALAGAYQMHLAHGGDRATASFGNVMKYINYTRYWGTSYPYPTECGGCNNTNKCHSLANGSMIRHVAGMYHMGGDEATNALTFQYDVDQAVSDPQHCITFYVYANGRVVTRSGMLPNTCNAVGCTANPAPDPAWFSWD